MTVRKESTAKLITIFRYQAIILLTPLEHIVMSAPSYRRVSSTEVEASTTTTAVENNTAARRASSRTVSERITDKLIAAAWVLIAVVVAYSSNFWNVVLLVPDESSRRPAANRALLQLAAIGLGTNTVLVLYLTVYLPVVKGLSDSSAWDVYCPRVIPTSTALSLLCALLLIRATWPVWGFLAPLILGVEGLGFLFALHFVPWPC